MPERMEQCILRGNHIVARCLENQGVDVMFAYPGGFSLELHQALSKSSIRVVLPRHEQGGAFAANGYARATGKVGVCMATSGPGATNLLTGIADAYMDSIPTVFITGQVPADMIGKNVFQETDIIGMTRPIVKHSYLVLDAADLPEIFAEAFYLAKTGRPGPILIDIPKNVQQQTLDHLDFNVQGHPRFFSVPPSPSQADADNIRSMIAQSKRPCVYFGGGIIMGDAAEELRTFVHAYQLPATSTIMALGVLPDDDPLYLGWLGMHGTVYANNAANECDLLIALGARFDDRIIGDAAKFAVGAKIIHVEVDDSEINKNKTADLGVLANVKQVLALLNAAPVKADRSDWFRQIETWKKAYPKTYVKRDDHLQPQLVIETLSRMTDGQAVIVPGVGQHQMWAAQYYSYHYPRQFLTSGGLGAMGFGLPAAMGAKVARPDKLVVNVDGDGSFQMNIQELGTLKVEKIPVKMIILDNQHLGMVAQWEDRFYHGNRGNTVLGNCYGSSGKPSHQCEGCDGTRCSVGGPYPDFVKIAEGYGIPGRHVSNAAELEEAIQAMLAEEGPFLIDAHTGYADHVLPMIPAGKDYKSVLTE